MDFMREAIEEARKGIYAGDGGPFGAVVVKNGEIIGRGHNAVIGSHDPTCHGEVMAIRDACRNLKTHDLSGCVLYTTAAPCPMCKGAILWANIEEVYYGCTTADTGKLGFRDDEFYNKWGNCNNHGHMLGRNDCLELFREYEKLEHELY